MEDDDVETPLMGRASISRVSSSSHGEGESLHPQPKQGTRTPSPLQSWRAMSTPAGQWCSPGKDCSPYRLATSPNARRTSHPQPTLLAAAVPHTPAAHATCPPLLTRSALKNAHHAKTPAGGDPTFTPAQYTELIYNIRPWSYRVDRRTFNWCARRHAQQRLRQQQVSVSAALAAPIPHSAWAGRRLRGYSALGLPILSPTHIFIVSWGLLMLLLDLTYTSILLPLGERASLVPPAMRV